MSCPNFVKKLDMFGKPIPQFNIAGEDKIQTSLGTVLSIVTIILTFAYGILQLQYLIDHKSPSVDLVPERIELDSELEVLHDGFQIAFNFEGNLGEILPYNSSYVRWIASTFDKRNNTGEYAYYEMQPCSQDEFDRFYPAESAVTDSKVEALKKIDNLFCLPP